MFDRNGVLFQLPLSPRRVERGFTRGFISSLKSLLRRSSSWILALSFMSFITVANAGPKIEHWTLANGARIYFVQSRELPMLQIRAVFDAGASRDPVGKFGLARLTSAMMDEGADKLNADDIATHFENLGAEFGADSDRDMASVYLRSLSDKALMNPALDLFARILAAPSFPQASLDRQRSQSLVALQKDAQSPGAIAEKIFSHELYGDHPYAHDALGDEAGLMAITREDLLAHHRRYYAGANVWLVIVGDTSLRQAKKISEQLVGQLPVATAAEALAPVPLLTTARTQHITFPASQSHVFVGQPGVARGDPDYFPLYVGNYIFGGGGLVSRLSEEVREKNGLSYSVYSYFLPLRQPGPFTIGLQTKNSQRDQALQLVRRLLDEFVAKGPSEQELIAAKKHITGSFPLRLDSNGKIAENLAVISFYGLPLTYLDDFISRIEAVTSEQIRDAFKRRLYPDTMVTVTVGGKR